MHGIRGGIAVSDDLKNFEILSLSTPDNRNMVLFSEKINGNNHIITKPMSVEKMHTLSAAILVSDSSSFFAGIEE